MEVDAAAKRRCKVRHHICCMSDGAFATDLHSSDYSGQKCALEAMQGRCEEGRCSMLPVTSNQGNSQLTGCDAGLCTLCTAQYTLADILFTAVSCRSRTWQPHKRLPPAGRHSGRPDPGLQRSVSSHDSFRGTG